jgi:hypothetical protein
VCLPEVLTALSVLRIFNGRAGHAALKIILYFSWSMRGLHRKWKQPAAYYFGHRSTKAEMTVQFWSEVLDVCQNTGLRVVTTVCDMGDSNVKALKLLGTTQRKLSFRFRSQDITTVYDLPHLLKCTWNLLLTR